MIIYKKYPKLRNFHFDFPKKRIFKFKRSKWKVLKIILKSWRNRKVRFFNFSIKKIRSRRFQRIRPAYRNGLTYKNAYLHFFNKALSFKNLKGFLTEKNFFKTFFIKPFLKLDILLWKLRFFNSVREAQQEFKKKHIFINDTVALNSMTVKKGDLIRVGGSVLSKKTRYSVKSMLFSLCEVDYYMRTVVILKDLSTTSYKDCTLLYRSILPTTNFNYYLRRN